jgi:hypothetical protein
MIFTKWRDWLAGLICSLIVATGCLVLLEQSKLDVVVDEPTPLPPLVTPDKPSSPTDVVAKSVTLVDQNGVPQMRLYAVPTPTIEVKDRSGKIKKIDLLKLIERFL